jgi:hypothetical protein
MSNLIEHKRGRGDFRMGGGSWGESEMLSKCNIMLFDD